jgi:hypothetical protein
MKVLLLIAIFCCVATKVTWSKAPWALSILPQSPAQQIPAQEAPIKYPIPRNNFPVVSSNVEKLVRMLTGHRTRSERPQSPAQQIPAQEAPQSPQL